jgi:hypothetical protein
MFSLSSGEDFRIGAKVLLRLVFVVGAGTSPLLLLAKPSQTEISLLELGMLIPL